MISSSSIQLQPCWLSADSSVKKTKDKKAIKSTNKSPSTITCYIKYLLSSINDTEQLLRHFVSRGCLLDDCWLSAALWTLLTTNSEMYGSPWRPKRRLDFRPTEHMKSDLFKMISLCADDVISMMTRTLKSHSSTCVCSSFHPIFIKMNTFISYLVSCYMFTFE